VRLVSVDDKNVCKTETQDVASCSGALGLVQNKNFNAFVISSKRFITTPPIVVRSIVVNSSVCVSVCVCQYVCLSASTSL